MTYQIADWNTHFENDRSRQRAKCSFVCVPNKQHGMGFCRIMAEPDGATIYGVWHLILGACSQQSLPRNGWLTDGGDQTGSPWGVSDLALKFRRPEKEIERALQVLTSDKVKWILTHDSPHTNRSVTVESPLSDPERKKEEKEEKGKNGEFERIAKTALKPQTEGATVMELKTLISELFGRSESDHWSYMEESLLVEVAKRPKCGLELNQMTRFKARDPQFFPQSVEKLLSGWTTTLDRARANSVTLAKPARRPAGNF